MNQEDGDTGADDPRLEQTMRRCMTAIDQAADEASRSYRMCLSCEIALIVFLAGAWCAFTPGLLPGTWRVVSGGVAAVALAIVVLTLVSSLRTSRHAYQHVQKTIAEEFGSDASRP